ncbi:MAG: hypothetical protein U0163_13845 [Gemmatimonadaceae bacterium]
MDTFAPIRPKNLDASLSRVKSYDEVNVEEFIEGDEYTYDTICVDGNIVFENVCFYRPNPLIARSNEWVSPQTLTVRDMTTEAIRAGVALGHDILKALEFKTGFTHMEEFYTANKEAVFGEIAACPAGAQTVDLMNYTCDW